MKSEKNPLNIVFVVCHPDDEAVWAGGIIASLSSIPLFHVFVICLNGKDSSSPREEEFFAAKQRSNYYKGLVCGMPLQPAGMPLVNITETVQSALGSLDLLEKDISLMITHSPYGDEQHHPHHRQAFVALREWTLKRKVPFGFFSTLPIPAFSLFPKLGSPKRLGKLQVLNISECRFFYPWWRRKLDGTLKAFMHCPSFYIQFLTNLEDKISMLQCYKSVGLEAFEKNYAAFGNPCESVYLFGKNSLNSFQDLFDLMELSEHPSLNPQVSFFPRQFLKLRNLFRFRFF